MSAEKRYLGLMRAKVLSYSFIALSLIYGSTVVFADQYFDIEIQVAFDTKLWALLVGIIFGSWFLRYLRWNYLLSQLGHHHSFVRGFVIYLSGFAYSATPGKGGELVRLRYLSRLGVSGGEVLAAFLYERSLDLLIVLFLACLAFLNHELFYLSTLFVIVVVGLIVIIIIIASRLSGSMGEQLLPIASITARIRHGLSECGSYIKDLAKLNVLFASISLGLAAWFLVAISFVLLLDGMKVVLPMNVGLSAYPLSMLSGAASMLPGGVGATEASLAFILTQNGVFFSQALTAAIAIRLLTLWSAIAVGILCVAGLELYNKKI